MTLPWTPTKGPKTKRMAQARLRQMIYHAATEDSFWMEQAHREIPDAWATLELDVDVIEPKDKVTLYLDRSVARMFRAMGQGYQARINRILATWMQMKLADHVALEMDMLARIKKDHDESKRAHDISEPDDRRKELHENWAYTQGYLDARLVEKLSAGN